METYRATTEQAQKPVSGCIHFWMVGAVNSGLAPATCKKCGAKKTLYANWYSYQDSRKAVRQ